MFSRIKIKYKLIPLFCLALLISLIVSSLAPLSDNNVDKKGVISWEIFDALENEDFVPVIIFLNDRANLDEALKIKNPSVRANEVVAQALQETFSSSEEEILPFLKEEIEKGNLKNYRPLWIVNAFAAKVNREALLRLSSLPQVKEINPDRQHGLPDTGSSLAELKENGIDFSIYTYQEGTGDFPWNLEFINAPQVWEKGIDGRGVVVAIMDTGVNMGHPALKEKYRGNLPGHSHKTSWFDAAAEVNPQAQGYPRDPIGHGTHIAGVILGGSKDNPLGVAPGASWIGVNIFSGGHAWDSHIARAFQWLLAPGGDPANAPHIINCSWATRSEYVKDYLQWELLHILERAGIFVVFAAGNNGDAGPGSPASYPHAFSVGAVKKEGNGVVAAGFSSRGPVTWEGMTYTKPEITAPGTGIKSAWLQESYQILDGTSMSAAHISGTAALLLQANPRLSPSEIRYILKHTAYWDREWDKLGKRPNNYFGYGIVDALAALSALTSLPSREILFEDGAEEGIINWSTSPANPWKITREKVSKGSFAFADSPWGNYRNNENSWLALSEPIYLCGHFSPLLTFDHFYDFQKGRNREDDYGYLEISLDGTNWSKIYRFSGTNEKFEPFSIFLHPPAGAEKIYLRFRLESNNNGPGRGWYIDNISISALPLPPEYLEKLVLIPERTKIGLDETIKITANAYFCSKVSRELDPELISWSSSEPSVVRVQNGMITGITPGESTIRGEFAGKKGEVKITVIDIPGPLASPPPGLYINEVKVNLESAVPGTRIYYTLDGTDPDEESELYIEPLIIQESKLVKARAYLEGIPGSLIALPYTIKDGAFVTGSLELQGRSQVDGKTRVYFLDENGNKYLPQSLSPRGEFNIELPLGKYRMVASREQYLTRVLKFKLDEKGIEKELQPVTLPAGDINSDNRIDIHDLTLLSLAFQTRPGNKHWNPLADLNGDGIVDILDLTLLTKNYGLTGDKY